MFDLSKKRWQWLSILFLALVWGSSFILMKKGLLAFSFVQVAAIRILVGFIVLIPLMLKHYKIVTHKNIWSIVLVGYAGIFIPAFLFTLAQTNISSSLAGMLNSTSPLFALVVGIFFYNSKPLKAQTAGIIIGFIGALTLVLNGNFSSIGNINVYALFIVLATFGYGINANEVKFKLTGISGIKVTALSFLFIGPVAGIVLAFTNLNAAYQSEHFYHSLMAVVTLSVFGSVISLFVYNSLIQHTSALFATSVTYVIPIFAILWGLFDGETVSLIQFAGMAIVLLGVYMVNVSRNKLKNIS